MYFIYLWFALFLFCMAFIIKKTKNKIIIVSSFFILFLLGVTLVNFVNSILTKNSEFIYFDKFIFMRSFYLAIIVFIFSIILFIKTRNDLENQEYSEINKCFKKCRLIGLIFFLIISIINVVNYLLSDSDMAGVGFVFFILIGLVVSFVLVLICCISCKSNNVDI